MDKLDNQLAVYKDHLIGKVKLKPEYTAILATQIRTEILENKSQFLDEILKVTPISLNTRLEELHSFQIMMETLNQMTPRPEIVRSQVITQNYICFVYLKDTLFEVLRKNSKPESAIKKCTKFLVNNPVRAFRNAIAHGNWKYTADFTGLEYWSQKDGVIETELIHYTVTNEVLNFWQMLSRMTAYVAYLTLEED